MVCESIQSKRSIRSGSVIRSPEFLKRAGLLVFVLLATGACNTQLTVRRHQNVAITDAAADQILTDFSQVIWGADSAQDFACTTDFQPFFPNDPTLLPALYTRWGAVGTYAETATINSEADADAVFAAPGFVKVVGAINWCGQTLPNLIGCAPTGGNSMIVVRRINNEGQLWAHEYGHTGGLDHRNGASFVMNPTILSTTTEINASECVAMVSRAINNPLNQNANAGPPGPASGGTAVGNGKVLYDGDLRADIDENIDVVSFVRQVYVHGTPMGFATRFDRSPRIPQLLAMLRDSREQQSWGNIVAVLGMIGDRRVAGPLMDFVSQHNTRGKDWEDVRVLTSAMMGLGYLANHTGDRDVLAFLDRARSAQFWADAALAEELAFSASIGLALSGTSQGRQSLLEAYRYEISRRNGAVAENLLGYLELNDEIAREGLRAYYAD